MRRSIALFLGLATVAFAQDSAAPSTDSSMPTSTDSFSSTTPTTDSSTVPSGTTATNTISGPITHTVAFARGGHTFEPDVTLAKVGDTILFQFNSANHFVIRAEYGYPCIPYEDTGVDKIGFFSGFKLVDAKLSDPPSWSLLINDTNPIFYYCGASGSCINYQMVGVINPNATTSLETQKQLAKDSTFMLLPGEPWPDERENPFITTSSAPTSSPTAAATNSVAASSATSEPDSSSGRHLILSAGAIAGIVIGASALTLAAAGLLYMCSRKSRRESLKQDDGPDTHHTTAHQMSHNPYMDPTEHMSMHSSAVGVGPALPGYIPQHDPAMSPLTHPAFPMSNSHSPGPSAPGDDTSNGPSPSQMYVVPAYSSDVQQNM
ncbi:uncharacterized protein Z518_02136 [Rhinocladiella mackenziei CBS 650.93]|uniref:Rhinocladiella mackenziei CBS 650.93 unplaced genomic scaffold supercont1.2, whole genome shotgun sequence n=1 Tax=Rhinocladiella mackenziei CBS 650.93 TaxID=1442369 RepID=A0A0D2HAJ4_9EURO|nr:uncharacterized protein Z518_02136 [Rhinocladiella mackenziei CBS 650.93]KIX07483.1 hypothetical protein Z518_02136 [Rhinocladiella mackenziei CBS 650.93]